MAFSETKRRNIYSKTDGKCHLCHKKLALKNYGNFEGKGAWEVEHSIPQTEGGTDHLNNLYAACISCNRSKGKQSTQSSRAKNGNTKAPYSAKKKDSVRTSNTIGCGVSGLVLTALMTTNPIGLLIGTVAGGVIGSNLDPEAG